MKSYMKRIRALRRLAIAGSVAALAVPTSASAMLPNDSGVHHESAPQSQPYTPPSGFHTEAQTAAAAQTPTTHFTLRRSVSPQGQPQASSPVKEVVRQIETVKDNSGRTLAIVLAAVALAVALGSLAFQAIRMTQMQRRMLSSN